MLLPVGILGAKRRGGYSKRLHFEFRRSPNPHVAFGGGGSRLCLGASLPGTELPVMICALLRRFDVIEVAGEPTWRSAGPAVAVSVAVQWQPRQIVRGALHVLDHHETVLPHPPPEVVSL